MEGTRCAAACPRPFPTQLNSMHHSSQDRAWVIMLHCSTCYPTLNHRMGPHHTLLRLERVYLAQGCAKPQMAPPQICILEQY